jgi:hypothetical protein
MFFEVGADHFFRRSVQHDLAFIEQDDALAKAANGRHVVGDEQNGFSSFETLSMRLMLFWRKAASPTESTSSTMRISTARWAATAKPRRTRMPLE